MDQVTLLPGAAFDYDMPCALRVARDRCWDDPLCGWCADLTAPQENQTRFAGKCYQACQWIWDASTATSGVGGLNTFDPELDGRCPIQHQKEWQLRPDGTTCMIADAVQGYMTMVTLLTVLFFVRAILEFVGSFSCCSACSCCAPSGMGKGTSATAKPGDGALAIKTRRLFILCWILTHSLLYASLVRYQVLQWPVGAQKYISAVAIYMVGLVWGMFLYASGAFFQYVALLGQMMLLALLEMQDLMLYHEQQHRANEGPKAHRMAHVFMGFVHLSVILSFGLAIVDLFASDVPPVELVVPQVFAAMPATVHLLEGVLVYSYRAWLRLRGQPSDYTRVAAINIPEMRPFGSVLYD